MRFYLDHNVDATCRQVLIDAGHEAWTTAQAGRGRATDDDQTIYAMSKGAVLITHDAEFTNRRKRMPYGHHVRLKCAEMDGPDLLGSELEKVVAMLSASPNMVLEVSPGTAKNGPQINSFF